MPPWMTSLLRDDTPLPMPLVCSATMTSWPFSAAARATASPTTPAPTTRTCMMDEGLFAAVPQRHGIRDREEVPCPERDVYGFAARGKAVLRQSVIIR